MKYTDKGCKSRNKITKAMRKASNTTSSRRVPFQHSFADFPPPNTSVISPRTDLPVTAPIAAVTFQVSDDVTDACPRQTPYEQVKESEVKESEVKELKGATVTRKRTSANRLRRRKVQQ